MTFPSGFASKSAFQNSVKILSELFSTFKGEGGVTLITGAGVSTDSGIPDYRGPNGVYTLRSNFKPITYQDFVTSHDKQKRYWARSFFGYPKFLQAKPNESHLIISELEKLAFVKQVVTQNVDSLHFRAGSSRVIELHGSLRTVSCITCSFTVGRNNFQRELENLNPLWGFYLQTYLKSGNFDFPKTPDGDVLLPDNTPYSEFKVPCCPLCNGVLKPNVVFFGENMTSEVRHESMDIIEKASALLVIGTSLTTLSSYRLFLKATQMNKPAYILNNGKTRADDIATSFINEQCTPILVSLLNDLKANHAL